jgi:rhamnosyltransferase
MNKLLNPPPEKLNVCAVIVTYNPEKDFENNLNIIKEMVKETIVVDNFSSNISYIERLIKEDPEIILVKNNDNLGIASALNQGVEIALSKGYNWLLTFDQDSNPDKVLLEIHKAIYESIDIKDKVSIIGSNYTESSKSTKISDLNNFQSSYSEVKTVITSGSLVNLNVLKEVGAFRDSFFIDAVDHEYCLRSIHRGFKVYLTKRPLMYHNIGNITNQKLLFWNTGTTNHSPLRRYYMFRNNTILNLEYLFKDPIWVIKNIISKTKTFILVVVFEREKNVKMKMMIKGMLDGLFLKGGKLIK